MKTLCISGLLFFDGSIGQRKVVSIHVIACLPDVFFCFVVGHELTSKHTPIAKTFSIHKHFRKCGEKSFIHSD